MRSAFRLASLAVFAALVAAAPPARAEWPAGLTLESVQGSWVGGGGGIAEAWILPGTEADDLYAIGTAVGLTGWSVHRFRTGATTEYRRALPYGSTMSPSALDFGFAPDGAGGFLDLYADVSNTVRSLHVDASGAWQPPYSPATMVDTLGANSPVALAAPGGGAWYAWRRAGIRLERVAPDGSRLAPWPARGVKVPGLASGSAFLGNVPGIANDGEGGVILASTDSVMRVQRIGPDTTLASGWPAGGLQLRTPGSAMFMDPRPSLVASGAQHFIACWIEWDGANESYYAQRFGLDGTIDPAWPAAGILLGSGPTSGVEWMFRCFAQDDGGVTVTWVQPPATTSGTADVYTCRVLADGSFAPGYAGGEKVLASVATSTIGPQGVLAVCPGRNGGLIVVWVASDFSVRGRWYDAAGAPDPDPARFESDLAVDTPIVGPSRYWRTAVASRSDGSGGAYVLLCWTDSDLLFNHGSIAHVTQHSVLDVPPVAGPAALALAVSPNPAHGAFAARVTLPDDSPATLELLDVSGRRVWSRAVHGAGTHAQAMGEGAALAPGVYLARLVRGGEARTARVAILR